MGCDRRKEVEVSPRKGSNRIKGNARRTQAETGRSYTASLRESAPTQGRSSILDEYLRQAAPSVTMGEFLAAVEGASEITTKIKEREAVIEPSKLAVSTLRFSTSFETITRGGVLSVALHRVSRAADGLEPLVATGDPSSRGEIMRLAESPSTSGLIDPEALSHSGALWIITLSEIGGDFGTRWQNLGKSTRVIQDGGDPVLIGEGADALRVKGALDKIRNMSTEYDPLERFASEVGGMDPARTSVTPRGLVIIDNHWAAFISTYTSSLESGAGEMATTVEVLRAARSYSAASYYLDLSDRRHAVSPSDLTTLSTRPRSSGVLAAELSQSEDVLWVTRTTVTQLRGGEVADETIKVRAGDASMEALSGDVDLDAGIFDTLSSMS